MTDNQNWNSPRVSVVVPTIGRPELVRALRSVRAQSFVGDIELIVVNDAGPGTDWPIEAKSLADRVVETAGRVGGSRARNLGIAASTGDLVALLDDDDEWLPDKLALQIGLLEAGPDPTKTVVAGRQYYVSPDGGPASHPGPDRMIGRDEKVEHYLFRRRSPNLGRPSMYTSTLLCPRELAVSVPWDDSLARHQDWDWLIRLGRVPGTTFVQTTEPIARIQVGSARSISAGSDWRASLDWANRVLVADSAVYADFLSAQVLRYALTSRSWVGCRAVLAALWRTKQWPSFGPSVVGLAGLLPRRTFERAIVIAGR